MLETHHNIDMTSYYQLCSTNHASIVVVLLVVAIGCDGGEDDIGGHSKVVEGRG